jgi:hypothetical protein
VINACNQTIRDLLANFRPGANPHNFTLLIYGHCRIFFGLKNNLATLFFSVPNLSR